MHSVRVLRFIVAKSITHQIAVQPNANGRMKSADQQLSEITVAKWMMNMCTFYSKSMAQKMTFSCSMLLIVVSSSLVNRTLKKKLYN